MFPSIQPLRVCAAFFPPRDPVRTRLSARRPLFLPPRKALTTTLHAGELVHAISGTLTGTAPPMGRGHWDQLQEWTATGA